MNCGRTGSLWWSASRIVGEASGAYGARDLAEREYWARTSGSPLNSPADTKADADAAACAGTNVIQF